MIIQPSGISVHIQDPDFSVVAKQIFLILFTQYISGFFPEKKLGSGFFPCCKEEEPDPCNNRYREEPGLGRGRCLGSSEGRSVAEIWAVWPAVICCVACQSWYLVSLTRTV